MNVLSLVIALLMMFAITTSTLLLNKKTDDLISHSYNGYMNSSRQLQNAHVTEIYKSIKHKKTPRDHINQNTSTNKSKKEKTREINIYNSRLDIYSLLKDGKENNTELYDLVAKLFKTLYSHQSFYQKNLEYIVLDNIIIKAKELFEEDVQDIYLAKIDFQDQKFQHIYYKILKGSKLYDFSEKKGIASFLDFIKVEKSNKTKASIIDASQELLCSLFNENIAYEIHTLQIENPPIHLTQQNIKKLCDKYHVNTDKAFEFLDFSHKVTKSNSFSINSFDKDSQISLKKYINL